MTMSSFITKLLVQLVSGALWQLSAFRSTYVAGPHKTVARNGKTAYFCRRLKERAEFRQARYDANGRIRTTSAHQEVCWAAPVSSCDQHLPDPRRPHNDGEGR